MAFAACAAPHANAASTIDSAKAIFDASEKFFRASGFSEEGFTPVEISKRGPEALLCRELAAMQSSCVEVDGKITIFSKDRQRFLLSKSGQNILVSAVENDVIQRRLEISSAEVLCASYLSDELSRGSFDTTKVQDLLRPVGRTTPSLPSDPSVSAASILDTVTGYIVFTGRDHAVSCRLLNAGGGAEVVAADLRLR